MQQGKSVSGKKLLLELAVVLALTGATFYVLFRGRELGPVLHATLEANWLWLGAAVLAAGAHVFFNGLAIPSIFCALGERVTVGQSLRYSVIEFFFSSITPANSGGQPAQAVALLRDGHSPSKTTICLVALTVLYKLSLVVLFLLALALNPRFLAEQIQAIPWGFALGMTLTAGAIGGYCLLLFWPWVMNTLLGGILGVLRRLHLVKDPAGKKAALAAHAAQYHQAARFLRTHPGAALRTFCVSVLQRVSLLAVAVCVFLALGAAPEALGRVLCLQLLIAVAVDLLPLPGGVGASEAVALKLYGGVFGPALMYPAMLLWRGVSYYLVLALSGLAVLAFRLAERRPGGTTAFFH